MPGPAIPRPPRTPHPARPEPSDAQTVGDTGRPQPPGGPRGTPGAPARAPGPVTPAEIEEPFPGSLAPSAGRSRPHFLVVHRSLGPSRTGASPTSIQNRLAFPPNNPVLRTSETESRVPGATPEIPGLCLCLRRSPSLIFERDRTDSLRSWLTSGSGARPGSRSCTAGTWHRIWRCAGPRGGSRCAPGDNHPPVAGSSSGIEGNEHRDRLARPSLAPWARLRPWAGRVRRTAAGGWPLGAVPPEEDPWPAPTASRWARRSGSRTRSTTRHSSAPWCSPTVPSGRTR